MKNSQDCSELNRSIKFNAYSLDQYRTIFDLNEKDLNGCLLDCAGGFSSFNKAMCDQSKAVISCDPLYAHSLDTLRAQLDQMDKISAAYDAGIQFLNDFVQGKAEGRYRPDALPLLDFPDDTFDLALCSLLPFLETVTNPQFYTRSFLELCRVAKEVRVFPLLSGGNELPRFLGEAMKTLQSGDFGVEMRQVEEPCGVMGSGGGAGGSSGVSSSVMGSGGGTGGSSVLLRVWCGICELGE